MRFPALRQAEAAAAAALQRLTHARNELESEERRSKERVTELERHIGDLNRDIAREAAQRTDAEATIERLQAEAAEIALTTDGADDARAEAEERLRAAEAELAEAEAALSALQAQTSDLNARRAALERAVREEMERAARFALREGAPRARDRGALRLARATARPSTTCARKRRLPRKPLRRPKKR